MSRINRLGSDLVIRKQKINGFNEQEIEEARMTVMAAAKLAGVPDSRNGTRTEERGLRSRQIRSVTTGKADKVHCHINSRDFHGVIIINIWFPGRSAAR